MWDDRRIAAQIQLHDRIRNRVRRAIQTSSLENLALVRRQSSDDTIYELDCVAESEMDRDITDIFSSWCRLTLVCEGQEQEGGKYFPCQSSGDDQPHFLLIIDPVDGTRSLIYGKRSAWILSAMAPFASNLILDDLQVAVQTEIPTPRSDLSDQLIAIKNEGVKARSVNLVSHSEVAFEPRPSAATTVRGGFATICRFFPPGRDRLAALDDALLEAVLGPPNGRAETFEDQYICTGGLLYQLATGRDRFVADLRGVLNSYRDDVGLDHGLTCHPYDLCTALIAIEAGAIITSPASSRLDFPLDTTTEVSWIGYANQDIRTEVESTLMSLIPKRLSYRENPGD